MKLKSLHLRGFKGLRAGMGVSEVSLDLASLPSGLVAICGETGMGKTTILDNMHPYRIMPFKIRKAKDWSPGAFSFYDVCEGPDACKDLVFDMGGREYRSLLLIDADRKKQEAYLYEMGPTGWVALNDGKVKTYDEAIERVVGSPTLFFSSVFRAQSAKNLSDYARSDIMGILAELLNVDHIREQGDKCRKVVSELSSRVDLARAGIRSAVDEVQAAEAVAQQVNELETELAVSRSDRESKVAVLDRIRGDLSAAQQHAAAFESERARYQQLQATLEDEKARAKQDALHIGGELATEQGRIVRLQEQLQQKRQTLDARLDRAKKIAGNAVAIREKVAEEAVLQGRMVGLRNEATTLSARRDALDAEVREHNELQKLAAGYDRELLALAGKHNLELGKIKSAIDTAERDSALLEGVDCRGDGSGFVNASCRFVTGAMAAFQSLPGLREQLGALQVPGAEQVAVKAKLDETMAKLGEYQPAIEELDSCKGMLASVNEAIATIEKSLAECSRWTKLVGELDRAEVDIKEVESELFAMDADADAEFTAIRERVASLEERLAATRADSEKRIRDLELQVLECNITEDPAEQVRSLEQQVRGAESMLSSVDGVIRDMELRLAGMRERIKSADAARGKIAGAEANIDRLNALISDYSLLAKACSNDGVIALELDDAAPSIAVIVNDLLRACYGARFSVRLDTQAQKADGSMREAFDIIVYDSETDEERSISDTSGGQLSWLEDAITRGICLFNIHRSDRVFATLFSDEKDGALDPKRKLEFLAVKRRALELGTHEREFFISHTPDLVEQADARIMLARGGVTIQ